MKYRIIIQQDDIKTLKSIHDAWQEIENGKGGKANPLWSIFPVKTVPTYTEISNKL